ncbi:MAG: DUF4838 domain-containing protein [Chloroflexales bacterium]|nr:DUF4838 domain-containing protein [Chloroflexales bacterium]
MTKSRSLSTIQANWVIDLSSADPVARFAAQELRRTLQRIGASPLPIVANAAGPRIALHCGAYGDGFVRTPDNSGLTLHGDGPRGLLYAVYDLLEALGCRWVAPGPSGEQLPHYQHIELPRVAIAQQPALTGRCLIIGHDFFLDHAEEWIVWAARNRLNTIFIHTIDRRLALGACRLQQWRKRRTKLLPLLRERGMTLELGGHGMADLVPRNLFQRSPEAFRQKGARRTPDHNFCPSNSTAQALLQRNGTAFFRAHSEAQIYHLWPDDILGGGWCDCPQCSALSPADQSLMATNLLAETLERCNPQARIAYLAYHDTAVAPSQIVPRANVILAFAPRPRSYAHGIANESNLVNRPFFQQLHDNIVWFDGASPGPNLQSQAPVEPAISHAGHCVFEYYLDGILFKSTPPPLPTVMRDDLRAYRDAGVHTVQALMTGDRPWLAAPLNAYLFARLAWEPEHNPFAILADYAAVRAPRTPDALVQTYHALSEAWHPVLDFMPGERPPGLAGTAQHASKKRHLAALDAFFAILDSQCSAASLSAPPIDILDYMTAPKPLCEQRLELLWTIAQPLARGRAAWDEVLTRAYADAPHLEAEQAEWELAALLLQFITLRQKLYVLERRAAPKAALRQARIEAQGALDALLSWGAHHLPLPRARYNYQLLRMLFQLHLDALHDRRLAPPWERVALRVRTYSRLAWLAARVALS